MTDSRKDTPTVDAPTTTIRDVYMREREFIHLLAQEQTVLDCLGSMRLIAED